MIEKYYAAHIKTSLDARRDQHHATQAETETETETETKTTYDGKATAASHPRN
jgi:hypothetical protein